TLGLPRPPCHPFTIALPASLALPAPPHARSAPAAGSATPAPRLSRLSVEPPEVTLHGPWDRLQVVVTGHDAAGGVRDLTAQAMYSVREPRAAVSSGGGVTPRANGRTVLGAQWGASRVQVPVEVGGMDRPGPVSLSHQVLTVLTRAGCNAGACHGTPSGKNGFRLSLRGYDPPLDLFTLTREAQARRLDPLEPDASLLLRKATARVPHGGGRRLDG